MYTTLKAKVRQGRIELLEPASLPENAFLLVVVLDDFDPQRLTLSEHLLAGLEDMRLRRVTEVDTPQALTDHLDAVFNEV
jgi:hypothetical protein